MEITKKFAKNLVENKDFWDDNYIKLPSYPSDGSRGSLSSSVLI